MALEKLKYETGDEYTRISVDYNHGRVSIKVVDADPECSGEVTRLHYDYIKDIVDTVEKFKSNV